MRREHDNIYLVRLKRASAPTCFSVAASASRKIDDQRCHSVCENPLCQFAALVHPHCAFTSLCARCCAHSIASLCACNRGYRLSRSFLDLHCNVEHWVNFPSYSCSPAVAAQRFCSAEPERVTLVRLLRGRFIIYTFGFRVYIYTVCTCVARSMLLCFAALDCISWSSCFRQQLQCACVCILGLHDLLVTCCNFHQLLRCIRL